jgi:hypothetical protein
VIGTPFSEAQCSVGATVAPPLPQESVVRDEGEETMADHE